MCFAEAQLNLHLSLLLLLIVPRLDLLIVLYITFIEKVVLPDGSLFRTLLRRFLFALTSMSHSADSVPTQSLFSVSVCRRLISTFMQPPACVSHHTKL